MSYIVPMAPTDDKYTIAELEEKTGLSRRTIHFYAAAGLIPKPKVKGGGARYGEKHLLRLQLIRDLKKEHLKLSGIRAALDEMTVEEMRRAAAGAPEPPPPATKEELDGRLRTDAVSFLELGASSAEPSTHLRVFRSRDAVGHQRALLSSYLSAINRKPGAGAPSSWERLELADGLELHIRGDVAGTLERLVKEIARLAAARKP